MSEPRKYVSRSIKIKNVKGTKHDGLSMIMRWRKERKMNTNLMCFVDGCKKDATDGAIVQVAGERGLFICPMCHDHNLEYGEVLEMKTSCKGKLVSVSKEDVF